MRLLRSGPDELDEGASTWLTHFEMRAGDRFGEHEHEHDQHQLCWTPVGVVVAGVAGVRWAQPTTIGVDALLREMILHLCEPELAGAPRARAEWFLYDLLHPLTDHQAALRLPADERAAAVAEALLRQPADDRTLDEWGRAVGASGRTLARYFLAETGVAFGAWRAQARVHAALGLLAAGTAPAAVAALVGYRDASAFTAVFRRYVGTTPARHARNA